MLQKAVLQWPESTACFGGRVCRQWTFSRFLTPYFAWGKHISKLQLVYGKRKNLMPDNLRVTDVPKTRLWVISCFDRIWRTKLCCKAKNSTFNFSYICLEIFRRITTRFYRKMHVKNENCGFSSEAIWLKLDPLTRLPVISFKSQIFQNFNFPWITRHKILHFSHTLTVFFAVFALKQDGVKICEKV